MLVTLLGKLLPQQCHLPLKQQVSLREHLVGIALADKRVKPGICLKREAGEIVGRCEPHAALVVVVLEDKYETDHLKEYEEEPVVVFLEKLYEIAHVVGLTS